MLSITHVELEGPDSDSRCGPAAGQADKVLAPNVAGKEGEPHGQPIQEETRHRVSSATHQVPTVQKKAVPVRKANFKPIEVHEATGELFSLKASRGPRQSLKKYSSKLPPQLLSYSRLFSILF